MRPGILVARPPGRAVFRYAFTPTDAVWLARLVAGAGAQYRGRRQALLWSVLARFALYGRGAVSLSDFVRRLAPSLPRAPWQQLPRGARRLALAAFTGTLPGGDASGVVRVVPRGYAPGQTSPYTYGSGMYGQGSGYGQSGGQYGWSGEMEFEEPQPAPTPNTKPSPPTDEPAQTGADAQTTSPPPVDAGAPTMEPPADDAGAMVEGGDGGAEPPMGGEPPPPQASFDTQDGNRLVMNSDLLRSLMAAYRRRYPQWRWRHPYSQRWRYPNASQRYPAHWNRRYGVPGSWRQWPYGTRSTVARPLALRRALVNRVGRLARGARRIGTLRGVRSGQRFPVFGGRVGGRNYRIVTRPRGRLHNEIMLVRQDKLAQELS
jgi:hypothetical protein